MPGYVDGFVLPLSTDRIDDYRKMAEQASKIWREHGALEYRECLGDDMDMEGPMTMFPKGIGAREGETVVFAWITYESREHRDAVNKKVMEDPRLNEMMCAGDPPFDCARMLYGGFRVIVEA